ncbi:MAG: hypothetical protein GY795_10885 [Desulfobacterales bacterium]|nr:hypothetical protein [Desulfobacterales bacterium]
MKFWQSLPGSVPKFHFGTPLNCQPKNEGCQKYSCVFGDQSLLYMKMTG